MHVEDDICNGIPWYHLNWIKKIPLLSGTGNIRYPILLTAEPGRLLNCSAYLSQAHSVYFIAPGSHLIPSSLNASNIHTLLAHRFHILKILVIINHTILFVKYDSCSILLDSFSLMLVKIILVLFLFEGI